MNYPVTSCFAHRLGWTLLLGLASPVLAAPPQPVAGLQFVCPSQFERLSQEIPDYLRALEVPDEWVSRTSDPRTGTLTFTLATPEEDTNTLDLAARPQFAVKNEWVRLPAAKGKTRALFTVSKKEIVLALMQHGRLTEFKGDACSLGALKDHVGVRQNIVAWAENLNWIWPNGGVARWNPRYWTHGTPNPAVSPHSAVMDAFLHQNKYAIGCYTATKLVMVQGVLDYYRRVKKDTERALRVEAALLADGEPLVGIEPGNMWSFEADFDPKELDRQGKLLSSQAGVAPRNFIPGDWAYLLNTDTETYQKTGYEGSNAIYLGRNKFDDYYNDHRHSYTYEQKLDEVYQWRNGVFSRSRDAQKIKSLTPEDLARLGRPPKDAGIELDIRVSPRYF